MAKCSPWDQLILTISLEHPISPLIKENLNRERRKKKVVYHKFIPLYNQVLHLALSNNLLKYKSYHFQEWDLALFSTIFFELLSQAWLLAFVIIKHKTCAMIENKTINFENPNAKQFWLTMTLSILAIGVKLEWTLHCILIFQQRGSSPRARS